jgi:tetratricopeptide (TPR) repeat protein
MALDPYTPCPCGSGKKLKFCECATESADLEKILTAIDGDQRVAALDLINRVLASKPQQKAMLALKGMVQMQLGDFEGARQTANAFLAAAPGNAVALTLSALIATHDHRTNEAVVFLQRAIAASPQEIHYLIPDALLSLAQTLVVDGRILAARAHLLLRIAMFGRESEDRPGIQMLMQLNSARDISLVQKQDLIPREIATEPVWEKEFDEALDAASNGTWLAAAQRFEALDKKHPNQPEILDNLAVFRTFLGQLTAGASWRRYAELPDVPQEDAIEAEMLAQELDTTSSEADRIDQIKIVYAVKDASQLQEALATQKAVSRISGDLTGLVPEGMPPPRTGYWLLDRGVPESGNELTLETVPKVLGEVLLFGKETDREARLEFLITRTSDMVAKVRKLQEISGGQLGMIEKEEKVGYTFALDEAMVARWRLPDDTSLEVRRKLIDEQYQRNMLEVLPKFPNAVLGGRTPREVAADPAYRVRLLALIRIYELDYQQKRQSADFNELRRSLGLPPQEPLDPAGVDMETVPLVRLGRFDFSKMTDDQLIHAARRASSVQYTDVMQQAALVALDRPTLKGRFEKWDALEILSQLETDLDKALEYNQQAQQLAKEAGRSPARYLLSEFDLRLARRESGELSRIISQLQSKHIREPGIAEAVYMKLVNLGLINPDGSPKGPLAPTPAAAPAGGVWTPEGVAAVTAGEQKSKLWLPGMD